MLRLCAAFGAAAFLLHAEAPATPAALFQANKVWTIHLKFTSEEWAAIAPKGGPQGFPFGGPGGPGGGPGRPPGGPGGPGMGLANLFAPAFQKGDTNGDGHFSRDEFLALGEQWFTQWDTRKTGTLASEELRAGIGQMMQAGMGAFRAIGPGGPGGLTAAEGRRNGLAGVAGIEFEYVHADVDFDGQVVKNAGVRYKGNGTYMQSMGQDKKSFKLHFGKFDKAQTFAGLTELNLHSNVTDPSWMNEVLSHRLYRDAKVPAPRTSYARVYVTAPGKFDRKYFGLYSLVEDLDENFLQANYQTREGALLKPSTRQVFEHIGDDWSAYRQPYDAKTKLTAAQKKRIIDFARLVSKAGDEEFRAQLPGYLDIDAFARYMAVTTWLSTLDSILGMGQNFYTYLNPQTNKFEFLPWDLDHSFGQFGMVASQEQREQLSILEPWAGDVKLLKRVYAHEQFRKTYLERMAEFDRGIFQPARLAAQVDELAKVLRPAVQEESAGKLERFDKVVAGETAGPEPGGFGGFRGPAIPVKPIKGFVTARAQSVREQLEGKSQGQVRTMGFGRGPGGPGGPGGAPPLERLLLEQFDTDKSSGVSHDEFRDGFGRWFRTWNTTGDGQLTTAQLRDGINKDLNPFRGGMPPPAGPPR